MSTSSSSMGSQKPCLIKQKFSQPASNVGLYVLVFNRHGECITESATLSATKLDSAPEMFLGVLLASLDDAEVRCTLLTVDLAGKPYFCWFANLLSDHFPLAGFVLLDRCQQRRALSQLSAMREHAGRVRRRFTSSSAKSA